jgi:O-antigen biosynthesis protein
MGKPVKKGILRAYEVWRYDGWKVLGSKIVNRLSQESYWAGYRQEARVFASWLDYSQKEKERSQQIHLDNPGSLDIRSITWFLPEFQHPYYGGIYTLLRFADYLKRVKGVEHHFMILGSMDEGQAAEKIASGFPALAGEKVGVVNLYNPIGKLEQTDAGISTLWGTAYFLLRFNQTKRKFYFIQDYEPLFYPAGSISAQVEASYRFGFYGIANTPTIGNIYQEQYGGKAEYFLPCVDTDIFYPNNAQSSIDPEPLTVFFYARPDHPRNGFELGAQALRILKQRLGNRVRIVAAGSLWKPRDYDLQGIVENLGLLEYRETAELYRNCQIGLVMMFTRHPSYLPLELMASGCLVVTNLNPATSWLLQDGENCRLSEASATCLADILENGLMDVDSRKSITTHAAQMVKTSFSNWQMEIEKIYSYMCNPSCASE